ncbi:MAG: GNAT family N-acetyltransferase [Acidobacteria bacterium]|nr:GNAT family N-acetyltransferase [Acidobacteriota bacterium]
MSESVRPYCEADLDWMVGCAQEALASIEQYRGGTLGAQRFAGIDMRNALSSVTLRSDVCVCVGTFDAVPVGFSIAIDRSPLADLVAIYVDPSARALGIGEALLESVIEWAHRRNLDGIVGEALPGDRSTKNFFETFGLVAHRLIVYRSLAD